MERVKNIAVVGNYLPRMCGIATFTTDLVTALTAADQSIDCWAVAINDRMEGYKYPDKVKFEINQNKINEYRLASDYLNVNQIDIVSLQHEYGIFGGETGSYILQLLRELRMPIVTTLHTVLKDPSPEQKRTLIEIARLSDSVVVMALRARQFLMDIYQIPEEKITFIHHGIPDMPFVDPNYYKDQFGVEGRKVILTFGLLSENKGVEYMIEALPEIVKKFPEVVYIVLGATHPHIKKVQGEGYRLSLERLARNCGVDKHVVFHNRFVDLKELCEFLGSADIYVTPYLAQAQIVSGTLAYALGVGKATVSTPYWYAEEMVDDKRGIIVPFKNSQALAEAVIDLFSDDIKRNAMRKRAYTFTRNAVWNSVAQDYLTLFNQVKAKRTTYPHQPFQRKTLQKEKVSLPEINLNHLLTLSDSTGIMQHASFSVPDYDHGYCVDDNARALIVAVTAKRVMPEVHSLQKLQKRYLAFIKHAYNPVNGYFRNFMSYKREWLESKGSDDSHARALWGLGVCCAFSEEPGCAALSTTLFHKGLKITEQIYHPRSLAFSLVGIHAYLVRYSGDSEVRRVRELLANRLFDHLQKYAKPQWPWFEDKVTYANAKIPQALLLSGQWMHRNDMTEMGFCILDWLIKQQTEKGHFSPIGNAGWLVKNGSKALFDQQPIEAQAMIEASLLAYQMTQKEEYSEAARKAFHWFLGQNDLNVPLYDYTTGGCRDGLQPDGANLNQGAESTLAWLISLIAMHSFEADEKKLQYVEELPKVDTALSVT